jgi:hypothetical protein
MNRVLPWLVRWACCARTRDFSCALAALVGHVQKYFFLTVHYSSPHRPASWESSRAVPSRLSLSMCLLLKSSIKLASLSVLPQAFDLTNHS